MSKLEVDAIEPQSGTALTIGASGDTITIPSGATINNNGTQTGFGRTGAVDWVTTPKTSTFTGVSGNGYFINSGSSLTCNLPAGTAGDIIAISDYARNFNTYNFIVAPNGSEKIGGTAASATLDVDGQACTFVYVDSTKGWVMVQNAEDTQTGLNQYSADFLVIAGGGGGGRAGGGGGGAGGYRNSYASEDSGGGGSSESSLTFVQGTVYTVTVGDGGAGAPSGAPGFAGSDGVDSSVAGSGITTITTTGGGGGGGNNAAPNKNGRSGGSGGGGAGGTSAGSGASGTSNQGFAGGAGRDGTGQSGGGGGGGSDAVGADGTASAGGAGGAGNSSSITGSAVSRGGGGGGGGYDNLPGGAGGTGGGGTGNTGSNNSATVGTANTGGGGGGAHDVAAAAGGKGVVILRVPTASYSGTTSGSPTVTTDGSDKVLVFNASGSYTG